MSDVSSLLNILVRSGLLPRESRDLIDDRKKPIEVIGDLVSGGLSTHKIMTFLSGRYGVPMMDLDCVMLDDTVISVLDIRIIDKYSVLPISKVGKTLFVAVLDPADYRAIEDIKFNTGLDVSPIIVESDKLIRAINKVVDAKNGGIDDVFRQVEEEEEAAEDAGLDINQAADEGAPVVKFIKQLLLDAIHNGASDIHIEPYEKDIRVRYRVDGILKDILHPPISLRTGIATRLKVMCRLDISERRLPQDGRLRVKLSNVRIIDFRVSFLPTGFGETIVLRLLDPSSARVPIESLGFLPEQRRHFEEAIRSPYGMILVTGPTGSGKTTTLYTALNILNDGMVNISTAEDPVEIPVYGINQVSINDKSGLTFSTALRSFLRQDPDIIMVGEVRDLETAETSIKAAQTGHLVLATLHTNDAPQSLTRLESMGIPTYNIAGTVHLVIAQRLARRLCQKCKTPSSIPELALIEAGFSPDDLSGWKPMSPKGCEACGGSGYKGRLGLYQVMPVSKTMQDTIMRGGSALDVARQSEEEGILTMRQSGLIRVKDGLTSLDEVLRVTNA